MYSKPFNFIDRISDKWLLLDSAHFTCPKIYLYIYGCAKTRAPCSLTLPFTMVAYCPTALAGGTCMDGPCPNRHDISRCVPCECSFPASLLGQHRSGKKHLRNVASKGTTNPVAPHQPPPPASNPPNSRPMSHPSAPSPAICAPNPIAPGLRATVSHENGLDFIVEGTKDVGQPFFSPVKHTILIEKTQVLSSLTIPVVRLLPATGTPASWYGLSDDSS